MRKNDKVLAMLVAGTMVVGSMTGCGSNSNNKPADTKTEEPTTAVTETTDNSSDETVVTENTSNSDVPLVIANDNVSEKFSPFFYESVPDRRILEQVDIGLIGSDRQGDVIYNGIEGETRSFNGNDYFYSGVSDVTVTQNDDGTVYYDFKLREDIKFSDGVPMTADDVIFSYYVNADPSYDGSGSLYSLPIQGMEEYRKGSEALSSLLITNGKDNTDFTYYTEETQKQFFDVDLPAAGEAFAKSICDYCIANYGAMVPDDEVANGMVTWGFATLNDDGSVTGDTTGTTWTLKDGNVPSYADYWHEMEEKYAYDYNTLSDTEKAEGTLFSFLADNYKAAIETGNSAPNISGIQKTGDYSVRVILTETSAPAIYSLSVTISPLHYYGDVNLYDYDNNMFGFPKGDLSIVREKTTKPLGAGPYKFVKYENKTVYLEANENFFLGAPKIKYVQYKETTEADKLAGVIQGTIDICDPSVSKDNLTQIKSENSNNELIGDKLGAVLHDYAGYGYIGMNSQLMKVGEDSGSEASKNFRKAIATIISAYRDVVIDSYYGEAASVINYPISNTNWAAPQKSDSDYKVAFSVDVNGNDIYTDGMSEEDKYAAAEQAALGFFEAAGYTIADGKITAAPEGGRMDCTLVIGGGGNGDHPSFGIVTAAKESLAKLGFKLEINDLSDTSQLWSGINGGTIDIWCAAWGAGSPDPDMFQIYHSEGGSATHYRIYQKDLDELVMEGRTNTDQAFRKAIYKEALEYVVDYAVEIPIYQRQEGYVFSTERINVDTMVQDCTSFYDAYAELYKLEMR